MDFSLFLTAIETKKAEEYTSANNTFGSKTFFYEGGEIEGKFDIAILGVKDSRGGNLESVKNAPDYFRKFLYKLYPSWNNTSVIDLGNIEQGATIDDTIYAVSEVVFTLVSKGVFPIIVGGGQELTYAMYKAYEKLEQTVNLVTVDRKIDLEDQEGFSNDTYLKDIILSKPNYLFNYANIGSQAYYLNPEIEKLISDLFFDNVRLGEVQQDSQKAEPILRNADILSFDMNAIRQSEVPGTSFASPNGFFGNEACQLTRYAGISDKLSAFGIFESTPEFDLNGQTFNLLAQMIWYFIEGFSNRKKESPISTDKNYTKYKVVLSNSSEELIFIKSKKSDRWWMKVPYPPSEKIKFERHHLVPCSYNDYQVALEDEMPDLWIKTYKKININRV
jgi:arginase family enzyme